MIYKHITETIGNTPLLEIPQTVTGLKNIRLYAKLEHQNPWGSVKDRTAFALLKPHLETGSLSGKTVLESSSGNTAKALQMLTKLYGGELKIITNLIKLENVKDILLSLGTTIKIMPGKSECFDPTDPNDPIYEIEREMQSDTENKIYTDQFMNQLNWKIHYDTTAAEILHDINVVDFVIGGLGTTGSTLGMIKKYKETNPHLQAFGLVADKDDFIPGIRGSDELLEIGLYEAKEYTEVLQCSAQEAIDGVCLLRDKVGVLGGPTAGINFYKSLEILRGLDADCSGTAKNAVFIVCDRYEWYIDYFKKRRPEMFGLTKKKNWQDEIDDFGTLAESINASTYQDNSGAYTVVDLRVPISYKLEHIPGALNFPYVELSEILNNSIPFGQNQKILFVCAVGDKSKLLSRYLRSKGYEASSLEGGMATARDAGIILT